MKKIISLLVLAMTIMFVSNADAQIKFGVKGGLNLTNMSFSQDAFNTNQLFVISHRRLPRSAAITNNCINEVSLINLC